MKSTQKWSRATALLFVQWAMACQGPETAPAPVDDAPVGPADAEHSPADEELPQAEAPALPEGFPLTLPPKRGRVVEVRVAAGRHVVVVESTASVEDLANLYATQIEALGLKIERVQGAKPSSTLVRSTEGGEPNVATDLEPTDSGHTVVRLSAKREYVAGRRVIAGDEELDPACVKFCEHEAKCTDSKADCATTCAPGATPAMPAVWACADKSCDQLVGCVTAALAAAG